MLTPVKAKGWATSKTNIIALLVILAGTLQQLADVQILPDQYQGWLVSLVGIIMMVMRFVTKQPVSTKPLKADTQYVEKADPEPIGGAA